MTTFLIEWHCPYCDESRLHLSENSHSNIRQSLNTHIKKHTDPNHGSPNAYPDDWEPTDADHYITVNEVEHQPAKI